MKLPMTENDFEAELSDDGYTEIAIQRFESRPDKGQHGHAYAIRGLVLDGSFTVTQDDQSTTYRPGQVFSVANGHTHNESVGPEGARVLTGRNYAVI